MRRTPVLPFLALAVAFAFAPAVRADKLVLVAGGNKDDDGVAATEAKLRGPFAVDFDKAGNTYIAEMTGHRVRKIDAKTGVLTTIAGTGEKGDGGDGGPAAKAQFNSPHHLAVAANGDVYVADTLNNRVRKIDAKTGVITTVAGTGEKGFSGDGGPAAKAKFGGVYCLAFDAKGEKLYVADLDNRRIRVVDLGSGNVTTVAGNGEKGVPKDGAEAKSAPLVDPRAVAVDAKGNVYVLERSGNALRVVDAGGKVRTVAGTGEKGTAGDRGPAKDATFNGPKHLCVDRDGNVLIADTENHLIRKYSPKDGKIELVAGTGKKGSAGLDGPPEKAELTQPHGVTVNAAGAVFVSDSGNNRVLKIEK
jgi:DNA-binding beta-propeller fold protein YncE